MFRDCLILTFPGTYLTIMYLALAMLIANFDLVPEDVVRERDIDFVGDFFVRGVRNDSPGVRVRVQKVA